MPRLERQAPQRLIARAAHDCQKCSGAGLTTVNQAITVSIPESMQHIIQNPAAIAAYAVCPRVALPPPDTPRSTPKWNS